MVNCPVCGAQLRTAGFNTGLPELCPLCEASLTVDIFPALSAKQKEIQRSEILIDEQASCFYHPEKKAATYCEVCGRFICGLCDLEIQGTHMCPQCLETGKDNKTIDSIEHSRTKYDNLALLSAILSFFVFGFMGFGAIFTFYLIVKHWKDPMALTGRTKIRFILAGLIGISQVVITVLVFIPD